MTVETIKETLLDMMEMGSAEWSVDVEDTEGRRRTLISIRRRNGRLVLSSLSSTEIAAKGLDKEKS